MTANKMVLFLILSASLQLHAVATHCPLDGFNLFSMPHNGYDYNANISIVSGDSTGDFYMVPDPDTSQKPRLQGNFLLGAETGDPLLNAFTEHESYENRDHRSLIGAAYSGRKCSSAFRFRYIDTYSDRFDRLWSTYSSITGNNMVKNNMGLTYEGLAAAHFNAGTTSILLHINPFGRWHATPWFFSPLLEESVAAERIITVALKRFTILSQQRFIRSNWYFDHSNTTTYNDNIINNAVSFNLNEKITTTASTSYNSRVTPSVKGALGIAFKNDRLNSVASVAMFSNRELAATLEGVLQCFFTVNCTLRVAHDYFLENRPYTFLQNDTVVHYTPRAYAQNSIFASMRWESPTRFPLRLSCWAHYNGSPLRESVDTRKDTVTINQIIDKRSVRTFFGVNGYTSVSGSWWSFSLQPGLILPSGNRKHTGFFIGKMAETRCSLYTRGTEPASLTLRCIGNEKPSLTYLLVQPDGSFLPHSRYAPATIAGYFSCRIPFIFTPLQKALTATTFIIEAGPLQLYGHARHQFHPYGNAFGPEIFAGFSGAIR